MVRANPKVVARRICALGGLVVERGQVAVELLALSSCQVVLAGNWRVTTRGQSVQP